MKKKKKKIVLAQALLFQKYHEGKKVIEEIYIIKNNKGAGFLKLWAWKKRVHTNVQSYITLRAKEKKRVLRAQTNRESLS